MIGTTDNGAIRQVAFGSYTGPAGVRVRNGLAEIAFRPGAPAIPPARPAHLAFNPDDTAFPLPCAGTIDGRVVVATGSRPSAIDGMVVLFAAWPKD